MGTIGEALVALRERSGLTLSDIAAAADYRGKSSVQKFFSEAYDPPELDMLVARRLARAMVGRGRPPIEEADILTLTGSTEKALERYQYLSLTSLKRDVPIYAATFALKKRFNTHEIEVPLFLNILDHPVDYAWHPPALADRRGFHGIMLVGAPLAPRFRPGEYIFVDSAAPPRLGDDVCVTLRLKGWDGDRINTEGQHLGELIAFGILDEQNFEGIIVRMMTGERVLFDAENVSSLHKVLTATDMLVK